VGNVKNLTPNLPKQSLQPPTPSHFSYFLDSVVENLDPRGF
jgi:hypothetical protein